MTQAGPLRWINGSGWLILSGGGDWQAGETGAIDSAALGWSNLDRPIAVLPTAGGSTAEGERLLDYYADLGGPSGYIVPVFRAADAQRQENCALLAQAGLIYIADGPNLIQLVQALQQSPALSAMERAFSIGAAILGMGAGAAALGTWTAGKTPTDQASAGWSWLHHMIVEPHFTTTESAERLRHLLDLYPNYLGLGIPEGCALALGPDGRVETMGEQQVTVVLHPTGDGSDPK